MRLPLCATATELRAFVPQLYFVSGSAELQRARQHLVGAQRVTATQQHLTQKAERAWIASVGLAGGDERRLRFLQHVPFEVHTTDGEHHGAVARVPGLGARSHFADQVVSFRAPEVRANGNGGVRVRVGPPRLQQLIERAHFEVRRILRKLDLLLLMVKSARDVLHLHDNPRGFLRQTLGLMAGNRGCSGSERDLMTGGAPRSVAPLRPTAFPNRPYERHR